MSVIRAQTVFVRIATRDRERVPSERSRLPQVAAGLIGAQGVMDIFGGGSITSDEEHGPPSNAPRASRAARGSASGGRSAPLPALLTPKGGALAAPER